MNKKQRRAKALAKREKFLAEQVAIGLEAQRRDRERREAQAKRNKEEADRVNRRFNTILAMHNMHPKEP